MWNVIKKHIPLFLFALSVIKGLIFGFSIPEVCIVACLGLLTGFIEYKDNEATIQEFEQRIISCENAMKSIASTIEADLAKAKTDVEGVKSLLGGVRLSQVNKK